MKITNSKTAKQRIITLEVCFIKLSIIYLGFAKISVRLELNWGW